MGEYAKCRSAVPVVENWKHGRKEFGTNSSSAMAPTVLDKVSSTSTSSAGVLLVFEYSRQFVPMVALLNSIAF